MAHWEGGRPWIGERKDQRGSVGGRGEAGEGGGVEQEAEGREERSREALLKIEV